MKLDDLVRSMVDRVRGAPRTAATSALLLMVGVCVTAAVWSCQSFPDASRVDPVGPGVAMPAEPDMRVRIRTNIPSTRLSGPARFMIRPVNGDGAGTVEALRSPVDIAVSGDGLKLTDARSTTLSFPGRTPIEIKPDVAGAMIAVDGTPYPGTLRVAWRRSASVPEPPAGAARAAPVATAPVLDVIEYVPIETYLPGVISHELYRDWPLGAFQVQAVCARTYALHERQRAMGLGRDYDVESTTADQVYGGSSELPVANQAVSDTRGVVLSWRGRLLRAYYSSTCGGRFASAADTWPTTPGYEFNLAGPIQASAREHLCQASPLYRWQVERDREQLSRQLREWGKANGDPVARVGTIGSVEVVRTNGTERPVRYRVTDTSRREFLLSAESVRLACNYAYPGMAALDAKARVRSGDVVFDVRGSAVAIRGRGFGHGVGMCQFCVKAMADRGDDWRVSALRFYPDARLERAY